MVQGEIVGASGRIGSAILRFAALEQHVLHESPRGCGIGLKSPANTPIFVCTGADSIQDVYERTVPERRRDLVFMQNGIIRTMLPVEAPSPTIAGGIVLYFSVLARGGDAKDGGCTYVYGRFSSLFAGMLRAGSLNCREVASEHEIDALAAEKLIWATCMWMVCHANGGINVTQVHDSASAQQELSAVVAELLPVARHAVVQGHGDGRTEERSNVDVEGAGRHVLGHIDGVLGRLEEYSRRLGDATPSKDLALLELPHRSRALRDYDDHHELNVTGVMAANKGGTSVAVTQRAWQGREINR